MARLTLDEAVDVRTDYLSNLSISAISDKYKMSQDKVRKILSSEDSTSKRLAEENIQIKFNKQTAAIQLLTEQGLTFLNEAIASAGNSKEPHLFLDKVASAIEKMDRIARLNLNRATEITENRTTYIRFDVAETIKALDTTEKQNDFLRQQLKPFKKDDRDKKDIRKSTATITQEAS